MHVVPSIRDLERTHGITWHELVDLEPKLAGLLSESQRAGVNCRRWLDVDRIFAPIRNSLGELVGFARGHPSHPVLGSLGAYLVAYWKLYTALAASLPGRAGGPATPIREFRRGAVRPTGPTAPTATAIAKG